MFFSLFSIRAFQALYLLFAPGFWLLAENRLQRNHGKYQALHAKTLYLLT
jgi:hypothetical protein